MMNRQRAERAYDDVPTLSETSRAAREALRIASRKATATINELGEEAYDSGSRARDELVRQVETQPLTAVMLAAGVGLLAGLLWARR